MLSFFGSRVRINSQSFESVGQPWRKCCKPVVLSKSSAVASGEFWKSVGVSIVLVMIVGT